MCPVLSLLIQLIRKRKAYKDLHQLLIIKYAMLYLRIPIISIVINSDYSVLSTDPCFPFADLHYQR